jgi:GxxExxY protein
MDENELSYLVVGAIIEVHRQLGPGLLEHLYQEALEVELELRGIPFERQARVPVRYKGRSLRGVLKLDFLAGGKLVLELKAVETLNPVHEAQLITYLKLTGCKLGLLVNFNVTRAVDGIHRKVYNF